ncbi:carbohydrate-binding module family 13 protein [Rhizophagus irregularis DAOM 181602=DAOM 197198]|uniref:Carbohydrate-binding module family 13 protein n=1 Tax=Rhizophagus irregularis (strain DAOM 181602 / DAOM 197198 / MUCL 43194) TaxID=747089 RepID=A0A2P4NQ43_RHIID|nr:carbohydrate-binding module family 13 protein [Rhizophagus irregularis DAOM 181602=DAOM 197198]POG55198.1 carbohydrate-binding module family 13 protein [Rhizophagus irregularis DAOM 181602=DAOM 197198]|eukprot:XP_025164286.1 carbohydrate-binding module family 13 protein [Rhizophagus irregularis DAOM 181602=DAOM 197198]
MTNYYWIIAQHSGKVLEVKDGSFCSLVEIVQNTKKSELDSNVDMQLWYFNGGFITNKRTGLVLDVVGGKFEKYTNIVQDQKHAEPSRGQEWVYNYADNSISLKFNRNFVLDVAVKMQFKLLLIDIYNIGDRNNNFFLNLYFL